MISRAFLLLLASATVWAGSAEFGSRATGRLVDGTGSEIGQVAVWQGAQGVVVQVRARELPPGMHGLHFHSVGDCSDIGVFKASGGHVHQKQGAHGFLHPAGAHPGDLPNIYAHDDGVARADFFSSRIKIEDLRDEDGAALIIHASGDDYQAPAIGRAGPRIACAVFAGER